MNKVIVSAFCFLIIVFNSCASKAHTDTLSKQQREELNWAKKICLSAEYGSSSNRIIKWAHSVTVSVIKGKTNADITEVVETLNELLIGTNVSVELLQYPDKTADIEIYLTDYKQFPSIAKENKFHYADGNWGYIYGFWNSNYELTKAYVLIATDKLQGVRLKHFIFEEIVQGFGLMNDSRTYTDSIFFSGNEYDLKYSSLSLRDKKLVKFIYSKMAAGDTKEHFEEAFAKYWNDL